MILLRTVKGVVFNPVIFMTILGLIVNVILTFGLHRTDSDDNKLPGESKLHVDRRDKYAVLGTEIGHRD